MNAERLYVLLLRLYPRAFREEFGADMLSDFASLRIAHARRPFAFWRLVVADVFRSAVREHVESLRAGNRAFLFRWLLVCMMGIVVTGTVVTIFDWAYRYFYHPFLEGLTARDFSGGFGACVGVGLGITQSLMLRFKPKLAVAWTAASAAGSAVGLFAIGSMAMLRQPLGPAMSGITLGCTVGWSQWLLLRLWTRRDGRWALATVVALAVTAVTFSAAIHSAFRGVNPLVIDPLQGPVNPYRAAIEIVVSAFAQIQTWVVFAVAILAMAVSAAVVGAFAQPVAGRNHAH